MAQNSENSPAGTGEDDNGTQRISARAKRVLSIAGIIIAIAIIAWTIRYQLHGKYIEGTEDSYIQADSVTVSPKISGYVEQVFVIDNQDVKAGQPLVRIDPRDYSAQTAQIRAQIDVARANADNVRAGVLEQEAAIDQARAQLANADNEARFAASEVDRYTPLAASGAETREKLASLRRQATDSANRAAAQRAAFVMAQRRIGSLRAQIRQADAQGEAATAQLSTADVNLKSTVIRASVNGRIGDKSVRVGQFVQSGTRLMTVVPVEKLYVTANFKETQLGLMRVGQPADIEVDALPGVELHGHVESISPGTGSQFSVLPPQNATGNFIKIVQRVPVRIRIDAGPAARTILVPGMSVSAKVDTSGAKGALGQIDAQERGRSGPAS